MDDESAKPDTEGRLRDLELGMRVIAVAPVIAVCALPIWSLLAVPNFARIFEDMLGAGKKLPDLTLFVMGFHHWILAAVVVWVGFCAWAAFSVRPFIRAALICAFGLVTVFVIFVAVQWALWAPVGMMIQQMQGGI